MDESADEPEKWRWVVVTAAFLSLFVNGSMGYITGVMHVALLETELYGVEALAWLGALFNCMFALTGPAASFVISRFSCRVCVVLSGVTCLLGFSLSSLVTDIRLLFVTYGFLAGFGRGLTYTGSLVVLGYYFPRDSSLVTGLSIAGTGLGMFIHPRMAQYLLDNYGLGGAYRLIGAITFHSCVCGFLMRPSKVERERKQRAISEKSQRTTKNPISELGHLFNKFCCGRLLAIIMQPSYLQVSRFYQRPAVDCYLNYSRGGYLKIKFRQNINL